MKHARIESGKVAEVIKLPVGVILADAFHPDLVKTMIECPENIEPNWLYDGKNFKEPISSVTPALDVLKVALQNNVDYAAEAERLKYVTDGVLQSMTYQDKIDQAVAYSKKLAVDGANLETMSTVAFKYPLLAAGIGIDGDTLTEVAETATYAYAVWQQVSAAIETTRLIAKAAIGKADTVETAQAIFNAVQWPNQ